MSAEIEIIEARGFWIGGRLIWQINGAFVSDRALRRWVYDNMSGIDRYVDVIRHLHTAAYASHNR
jgi:hypothetical protein